MKLLKILIAALFVCMLYCDVKAQKVDGPDCYCLTKSAKAVIDYLEDTGSDFTKAKRSDGTISVIEAHYVEDDIRYYFKGGKCVKVTYIFSQMGYLKYGKKWYDQVKEYCTETTYSNMAFIDKSRANCTNAELFILFNQDDGDYNEKRIKTMEISINNGGN